MGPECDRRTSPRCGTEDVKIRPMSIPIDKWFKSSGDPNGNCVEIRYDPVKGYVKMRHSAWETKSFASPGVLTMTLDEFRDLISVIKAGDLDIP